MTARPTMLILSYSPIARDARVLKQVVRFTKDFDVTTCGYGPAPAGVVEHLQIPDGLRADDLNGRLITLHLYDRAYWSLSAVAWSRAALAGRQFDVAIADDVEAVPMALRLRPRFGVLADLHEYSPRLHDEHAAWTRRIRPWFEWLLRRYVTKAASWSTVSAGIAEEYRRHFGFRAEVVTNAAPYQDLSPRPVAGPLKLVHSGACQRNRNLHIMAEAVAAAEVDSTLDFYLTPNDPHYLDELREIAARSQGRVRVHDPVPYERLIETLNGYDIGVFVLPPVNFSYAHALPNKLFDYVQARLGVLVGPSPEMARYVIEHGLGVVTADFTVESTRAAIESLSAADAAGFKAASHAAAVELSGEKQAELWADMIGRQLGTRA